MLQHLEAEEFARQHYASIGDRKNEGIPVDPWEEEAWRRVEDLLDEIEYLEDEEIKPLREEAIAAQKLIEVKDEDILSLQTTLREVRTNLATLCSRLMSLPDIQEDINNIIRLIDEDESNP